MFVSGRCEDEELHLRVPGLAEPVRIVVCGFKWQGGRQAVRIGIDAPDAVSILRPDAKVQTPAAGRAGVP